MQFIDRTDAGQKLAKELKAYDGTENTVIVGLPRGGVPVACEVARRLHLPLDITCPHKIGAPSNPEYAIGAVTESGETIYNKDVLSSMGIPNDYLKSEVEKQKQRARHQLDIYRQGRPRRDFSGKTVILVDDGLATGATMAAAIQSMRAAAAAKVVVAVPVGPQDTLKEMKTLADELVCLYTPSRFYAVGQFYQEFSQTSDEEVIELMAQPQSKGVT